MRLRNWIAAASCMYVLGLMAVLVGLLLVDVVAVKICMFICVMLHASAALVFNIGVDKISYSQDEES